MRNLSVEEKIKVYSQIKPKVIELHLTNFCNHACSWCVADEVRQNKWHFSMPDAKKLIKEFSEAGVEALIFSGGGDPFMFKGLEEILTYSHSLGISNRLINNGFGLKQQVIPTIAKVVDSIRISVDSGNRETHAQIHKPKNEKIDNYDIIMNNITNLLKEIKDNNYQTEVILTFVVVDESIGSIPEFIKKANELGVDEIEFKTNHFWDEKRKIEVYNKVTEYFQSLEGINIKMSMEYPKSRIGETSDEAWNGFFVSAVVEANGSMYPCCHKSLQAKWYLGNVLKDSFEKAWYGEERKNVIQKIIKEKAICPTCLDGTLNKKLNKIVDKLGIESIL